GPGDLAAGDAKPGHMKPDQGVLTTLSSFPTPALFQIMPSSLHGCPYQIRKPQRPELLCGCAHGAYRSPTGDLTADSYWEPRTLAFSGQKRSLPGGQPRLDTRLQSRHFHTA